MLTAIVTQSNGHMVHVRLVAADSTTDSTVVATDSSVAPLMAASSAGSETTATATAPNPIAAENKELAWTAGSFFVLLVVMRYVLFPKLKKGMTDRYSAIRSNVEGADKVKADAQADVAQYEAAVAAARAEAATRIDAARETLDKERAAKLAEVNSRIAARRSEADAATAAARAAAQGEIAAAVTAVATRAAELATGRPADSAAVQQAVRSAMESAGAR